jgi:hypothetical protein
VQHECDIVAEIQCIPEREQVVALFGVVVAIRTRRVQFVRRAHADHVGGDKTAQFLRGVALRCATGRTGGVAMRKDDCIAVTLMRIGHAVSVDFTKVQPRN